MFHFQNNKKSTSLLHQLLRVETENAMTSACGFKSLGNSRSLLNC